MDLSVTQFIDDLSVSNISLAETEIPALDIRGEDFRSVRDVLINGQASPQIVLLSNTRVIARIPPLTQSISSVSVISASPTATTSATSVSIRLPTRLTTVSGLGSLVQRVTKLLLTTPNSNAFSPNQGAGLLKYIASANPDNEDVSAKIASAIAAVEEAIIEDPQHSNLDAAEQLSSIEVASIDWLRDEQKLAVSVKITNALGQSTNSTLGS